MDTLEDDDIEASCKVFRVIDGSLTVRMLGFIFEYAISGIDETGRWTRPHTRDDGTKNDGSVNRERSLHLSKGTIRVASLCAIAVTSKIIIAFLDGLFDY